MLGVSPKILPPNYGLASRLQHLGASVKSRVFGPYTPNGSIERTQTYLIMSHDSNQAVLTLRDDKPNLTFLGVGRSGHVKTLNALLAKATALVNGIHINSPFFALEQQEVSHCYIAHITT